MKAFEPGAAFRFSPIALPPPAVSCAIPRYTTTLGAVYRSIMFAFIWSVMSVLLCMVRTLKHNCVAIFFASNAVTGQEIQVEGPFVDVLLTMKSAQLSA